ncbi:uncharacterized protein METZ01_LOCUS483209, partial [marine metagenome]
TQETEAGEALDDLQGQIDVNVADLAEFEVEVDATVADLQGQIDENAASQETETGEALDGLQGQIDENGVAITTNAADLAVFEVETGVAFQEVYDAAETAFENTGVAIAANTASQEQFETEMDAYVTDLQDQIDENELDNMETIQGVYDAAEIAYEDIGVSIAANTASQEEFEVEVDATVADLQGQIDANAASQETETGEALDDLQGQIDENATDLSEFEVETGAAFEAVYDAAGVAYEDMG